jgi:hypothetical protein
MGQAQAPAYNVLAQEKVELTGYYTALKLGATYDGDTQVFSLSLDGAKLL